MKFSIRKLKKNESGSVLITVVGVLSIITVFAMATLTVVATAQQQTYAEYQTSQAYYTARSTVDTFVASLQTNKDLQEMVNDLTVSATPHVFAPTTVDGMGEVTIEVLKSSDTQYKITAKTKYMSQESSASVNINQDPVTGKFTFDSALVCLGDFGSNHEYNILGGLKSSIGPINVSNGNTYKGSMNVIGNILFSASSGYTEAFNDNEFSVVATGNIDFTNGSNVVPVRDLPAYFNAGGIFKASGGTSHIGSAQRPVDIYCNRADLQQVIIYGNVYVYDEKFNDNIKYCEIKTGTEIHGDLYVKGNLSVSDDITVYGNIYVSETISYSTIDGHQGKLTNPNGYKIQEHCDLSGMPPKKPIKNLKTFFDSYQKIDPFKVVPNPSTLPVFDYTKSNKITKSTLMNSFPSTTINIEVGADPIFIYLSSADASKIATMDFNPKFNITFDTLHPTTPLYFCVPEGTTLNMKGVTIASNSTLARVNSSATTPIKLGGDDGFKCKNIYWLLGKNVKINATNNCIFEGYFFGPNAEFNYDGNGVNVTYCTDNSSSEAINNTKVPINVGIIGSLVFNKSNFINKCAILFVPPEGGATIFDEDIFKVVDDSYKWNIKSYSRN